MRVLTDLEPKNVFSFFEDICSIPHPSYKEEKISNYLVELQEYYKKHQFLHLEMEKKK
jgi:di/tripeptidase